MAVMTEELVPVLEDARQAHAAVLDRLRADATITPPGPYRQMLERQATEIQISLQRIRRQERALQPRGLMGTAVSVTQSVSRGAARTAMLPLTIGSVAVRGMLPGGGPADPRRLLRNAEDEYAAAARALAACRAGEVLAEQVDDESTADLLGSLRRQDEELLRALEDRLAEQARTMAASTNGFGPGESRNAGLAEAAAQTMRTVFDRAQDVAERGFRWARGAAEGAVRTTPEPGPMAEEILGAVRREEDLPIPGFSQLSTDQIERRLRTLSQLDLTVVEGYERAHANRKRVLDAIEQLREEQPWVGYDAMDPEDISASLQDAPSNEARQVLEYEQRHRQRQDVIAAAEARL
ncbi:hypothetical protein [Streptomyces sp. NL15-2K]|uniref:hypothetical protein n=1 Tax=Streptomyces sp. NL15-2K TaxID=376149 RepID=UPI000F57F01A|nr:MULTISPECIES: hypothetical protein [Actinomycetes]WKX15800.1 hypothetical protein Q4V64_53225 [Kutzneria buriramensis]GCB42861.1 hypothetical protein SNL152K_144 [Streptomyces sp. NL15-2K]